MKVLEGSTMCIQTHVNFSGRAILTAHKDIVTLVNAALLSKVQGQVHKFSEHS